MRLPDGSDRDFFDCPVNVIPDELMGYLRMFALFRGDKLWHGPELGKWPAKDLRAMEVLGDEVGRHDTAKRERERVRAGRR